MSIALDVVGVGQAAIDALIKYAHKKGSNLADLNGRFQSVQNLRVDVMGREILGINAIYREVHE